LEEQVNAAKQQQGLTGSGGYGAGGTAYKSADQAGLKMVNDTIVRSMQNIKFILHALSEACLKATSS